MNREDIRKLLNAETTQFHTIVNTLVKHILEPNIKAQIANAVVKKAKETNKRSQTDLFRIFFDGMRSLVKDTRMCSNLYAEQMMLKTVWERSRFQALVIRMIKSNLLLRVNESEVKELEVKELEVKEKPARKKRRKTLETHEERKARLKRQADLMRAAKAKKNGYKEVEVSQVVMPSVKPSVKSKVVTQVKSQSVTPTMPQTKKFTKEQLAQIELLRKTRV